MNAKPQFLIEPLPAEAGVFNLTTVIANVRRCSDGEIVATIHRSWRNARSACPGVPCWWFCSDAPGQSHLGVVSSLGWHPSFSHEG